MILEDVATDAELMQRVIRGDGMEVVALRVETEADFCNALGEFSPDIILSDFSLPHFDGMRALALAKRLCPEVPFIFASGTLGDERAVETLKQGASDYVLKNNLIRLPPAIRRALKESRERELRRKQEEKIARLTRIYVILSKINSLIVRVHDRQQLCAQACQVAVELGGFRLVSISLSEVGTGKLSSIAVCGGEPAVLDRLPSAEFPDGLNAVDSTDRNPVICNDLQGDQQGLSHREQAIDMGYRAFASLPLTIDGHVRGAFTLFSSQAGAFDEEEVALLTELAGDIAFALTYIEKEEKLNYFAYYDALTGLPNRTLFKDRLTQALNAVEPEHQLALVLLDVHRFRHINDSFGRTAGDRLLQSIAHWLEEAISTKGTVARLEADMFGLLVTSVRDEREIAHLMADQILRISDHPIPVDSGAVKVTIRAGVAIFPSDGSDADALMHNAETALRRAHETGEPYLFFEPALHARAIDVLTLENRLRQAVDMHQFEMYYQPKVRLNDGKICGVEALIRWQDPRRGIVLPSEFIGILETTGMIVPVGDWLIRQVILDCQQWLPPQILPVPVAINVSAVQLRQKDFVNQIAAVLNDAGSVRLDMEITESVFMQDIQDSIQKLQSVKNLGIGVVAIDDFGTGYSSLGYLAKLPVDALKIDRSFIVDMTNNPDSLTMVSTIISLGHAFERKIIAEGVESQEQANLLKLLRCDEMQGDLFSRALPKDRMAAMLRKQAHLQ